MDRIMLFGATTAVVAGDEVSGTRLGGAKPRQVLEALALAGGAPVTKDRLVDLLWGDDAPAGAVATLESYVCVLRRALGGGRGRDSVVRTSAAGYVLDTTRVTVDLGECRTLLEAVERATAGEAVRLARRALRLCDRPLLASETRAWWADHEREVFGRQLGRACATAAAGALEGGDVAAALDLTTRALAADPLDEAAARTQMLALDADGRRAQALQVFLALRHRLRDELGVEPSAPTREVYVGLLAEPSGAGACDRPSRGEVTGLLDLLRDALTRVPGLDQDPVDRALAGVASRALALL